MYTAVYFYHLQLYFIFFMKLKTREPAYDSTRHCVMHHALFCRVMPHAWSFCWKWDIYQP